MVLDKTLTKANSPYIETTKVAGMQPRCALYVIWFSPRSNDFIDYIAIDHNGSLNT